MLCALYGWMCVSESVTILLLVYTFVHIFLTQSQIRFICGMLKHYNLGNNAGLLESKVIKGVLMSKSLFRGQILSPGGYSNYFVMECAARGPKPLPISKDFSHSKKPLIRQFFRNFHKLTPISTKGFSASKTANFTIFQQIFVKLDPPVRIFLTKMGPMSKEFWWKSNPFGQHIPVCLNMWVPPPQDFEETALLNPHLGCILA